MRADEAYAELLRRVREETLLTTIEALLEWDEETYMPPGGVENRGEQLALIAGLLHERGTDPRIGELLEALEGSDLLGDPEAAPAVNVRALRREYDRFVRLPGFVAWWFRRTYYLFQMPRWDRRLRIVLDWTVALFFRPDITKVELEDERALRARELATISMDAERGTRS